MSEPVFDQEDQFERVAAGLVAGEEVRYVYDAVGRGTGFVGVTTHRVILQDNSFVGGRIALVSLPFGRISAVSFVSDKSFLGKFASSSTVAVTAGSHVYEATFRGDEKARDVHDAVLAAMLGAG